MNLPRMFSKLSIGIALILSSSSVFAAGGTVTFSAINPTSVPTLSGWMLIVLSLLLFAVAVKITGQKGDNVGKFFLILMSVGVLSTGTGGIKLLSDVQAGVSSPIVINTPYVIGVDGTVFYENSTGESLNFIIRADDAPPSMCGYQIYGAEVRIVLDPLAMLENPPLVEYSGVLTDGQVIEIRCMASYGTPVPM